MAKIDIARALAQLQSALEEEQALSATMAEVWGRDDSFREYAELAPGYWKLEGQHLPSSRRTFDAWNAIRAIRGADGKALEERNAADITAEVWEEIRAHLMTTPNKRTHAVVAPATRNRYAIVLKRLLNWCVEQRKLKYNPMHISLEQEDNVKETIVTGEVQFQQLLAQCDPLLRALVLLYYDAGLRRDEGIELQRHQLRVEEDGTAVIALFKTKRRKARTVVLTRRACEALQSLPDHGSYYFANPDTRKPYAKRYLYLRYQIAVLKSGLKPANDENLTFHDLRRSYCYVRRVNDKWAASTVMMQTGHSTDSVFRRYGIGDMREIKEAMVGVEARLQRQRLGPVRAPTTFTAESESKVTKTG